MSRRGKAEPVSAEAGRWSIGDLAAALALPLLCLIIYSPAIRGQYLWDDDDYVRDNPNLRHAGGLANIWLHPTRNPQYYPLVFTSYWLEWRIWGERPDGYHTVNILLHSASAVLLWRLLRRLKVPGAYFTAAIFAVHPVMVESVAWITERKNTLSMVFYLGAIAAYLRFAGVMSPGSNQRRDDLRSASADSRDPPRGGRYFLYALSLSLFICALLSKTVTATLPAALLLILWWKRGRIEWRHVALLAPFFALGLLAGMHTGYLERTHVGARGPEWDWSPTDRILIAGRAVWFYAAKLIVPVRQSFIYPKWSIDSTAAWQWLFPAGVVLVVIALFLLRRRIGRGPVTAALFFIGTLVPALGFVNVFPMRYSFVADHFAYHASIGLMALFAAAAAALARDYASRRRSTPVVGPSAATAVIVALSMLTMLRASVFASPRRLWEQTLARNPDSWMVWMNLAHLSEDPATAAAAIRKAHALAPDVVDTRYQLALLHAQEGKLEQAMAELERIVAEHPKHASAHQQLARILRRQEKWGEAATHLEAALEVQPDNGEFLRELADARIKGGHYAAAEAPLRRLIELNPGDADAIFDLATALVLTGRSEEAEKLYQKAIAMKPQLRARLPR